MKAKIILGYLFYIPVFILSYFILNMIFVPIINLIFVFFDYISDIFYSSPQRGFLEEVFARSFFIKLFVTVSSLSISNVVFPKKNKKIPVIVNSILLILILIGGIIYTFYSINILEDLFPKEEVKELLEGVSKLKIIMEFLGGLIGIISVFYFYKKEDFFE